MEQIQTFSMNNISLKEQMAILCAVRKLSPRELFKYEGGYYKSISECQKIIDDLLYELENKYDVET